MGLTRAKHAFFDEFNVLETYQPRARTMGHLFMVISFINVFRKKKKKGLYLMKYFKSIFA